MLLKDLLSTRYKDIFDFYYLINNTNIDKEKFNKYIAEIIYNDESVKIVEGIKHGKLLEKIVKM